MIVERVADLALSDLGAPRLDTGATHGVSAASGETPDQTERITVEPPTARTAWGGLPFLLHLVPGAPSRAVLQLAGLDLLSRLDPDVDPDDPALSAFVGHSPFSVGSTPFEALDPTPGERRAAQTLAVELLAGLLQRVRVEPPLTPDEVLELVCRRDAVIEADPGWIDVVLSIDSVVVEVRAAGLDLDLGYVPWLGCVVRFRYV